MNRFARLRYERGASQRDVVEGSGVSRSTVLRLERGERPKPNAAVAKALADFYGLTVAELLDPNGPVFSNEERAA